MRKTEAADRQEANLLDSPEALRALALKAKRFAESVPHEPVRRRIIESAARLEAEAALLERFRPGGATALPEPPQPNMAAATSTSSSRRTGLAR